ncbi:MAG TPA: hypothetical protein VFI54_06605 [Solirubrobacteraceae bacterium]|nr:hypothetical protein [Solirubrobacteraceae bacterium]
MAAARALGCAVDRFRGHDSTRPPPRGSSPPPPSGDRNDGVVNAANAISLYLLADELLNKHISNGRVLILSGIAIWLTNVLIFALWYWQLDRGGPANRARRLDPHTPEGRPDFVFSQMDSGRPYTLDDSTAEFLD